MGKGIDIEYCAGCDEVYATHPQIWLIFNNVIGESFRPDEIFFRCPRCYSEIKRHVGFLDSLKRRDDSDFLDVVIGGIEDLSPGASSLLRLLLENFTVPSFATHLDGVGGEIMQELVKKRYINSTRSENTGVFFATLNAYKLHLFDNEEILWGMSNQRGFLHNPGYLKADGVHSIRRKARREALTDDFTKEDRAYLLESFDNKCALTGKNVSLQIDHVLPLAIGHGGTTLSNLLPIGQRLNSSKGTKNIFEWYEENGERFEVLPELFEKAIEYLAGLNNMSSQEYRDYAYECHANPNDILNGGFIMSTEQPKFYCYSTTLMHFLKANGLRYLFATTHNRTGNRMWVFERDEVLRGLLDEYDARKAQARAEGRLKDDRKTNS